MRNKLRRRKKCEDASCPSKEQQRTDEVITLVLSESSCSDHETSGRGPASLAAKETCNVSKHVAAAGISTRKPPQEQRKTFYMKDIKIAPVFLHTAQHSKSKQSSDVKLDHESVLPPHTEDVKLVKSQQSLSTERKRSRRKQLSASALHICLEEIQTSNPGFPVQTVFRSLQKKASERLQDGGSTGETEQQVLF